MNVIESIVLGLVQGVTEFLPISSSGHLLIIRELFGISLESSLAFDVLLHLATLLVIFFYFWGDIRHIVHDAFTQGLSSHSSKLLIALLVGTIPIAFIGYVGSGVVEETFRNTKYVAYALIAGSILFFIADHVSKRRPHSQNKSITTGRGFIIGVFQAFALIPGTSRSGSTISGGLLFGLSREGAIRFAFLLGIPAICGAALKIVLDLPLSELLQLTTLSSILGFLAAFFSGLWAVRFLIRYLSQNSFTPFIIYRLILAGIILLFL